WSALGALRTREQNSIGARRKHTRAASFFSRPANSFSRLVTSFSLASLYMQKFSPKGFASRNHVRAQRAHTRMRNHFGAQPLRPCNPRVPFRPRILHISNFQLQVVRLPKRLPLATKLISLANDHSRPANPTNPPSSPSTPAATRHRAPPPAATFSGQPPPIMTYHISTRSSRRRRQHNRSSNKNSGEKASDFSAKARRSTNHFNLHIQIAGDSLGPTKIRRHPRTPLAGAHLFRPPLPESGELFRRPFFPANEHPPSFRLVFFSFSCHIPSTPIVEDSFRMFVNFGSFNLSLRAICYFVCLRTSKELLFVMFLCIFSCVLCALVESFFRFVLVSSGPFYRILCVFAFAMCF
ncbi:Unknown protein, partial [Striga hermonthica]